MKLVILYFLVAVAFFYKGSGSHFTAEEDVNKPFNCTTPENACSDDKDECDLIFLCIPGVPDPIPSMCPPGRTCNAGNCSLIPSPLCEYRHTKFKCNTPGMYPEPSSCKEYNYCLPPGNTDPIPGKCPEDWAYNSANTLCDIRLTNNTCADSHREIPTCKSIGQDGALDSNSALYYICLPYSDDNPKPYPHLYKCPGNTKYIGNYQCQ